MTSIAVQVLFSKTGKSALSSIFEGLQTRKEDLEVNWEALEGKPSCLCHCHCVEPFCGTHETIGTKNKRCWHCAKGNRR